MHYVIIGNSAAAIGAVEGIRKVDQDGDITIITDEPHHTYSRPLISYLLLGKVTEERMNYRALDFDSQNRCEILYGTKVVAVDNENKTVTLSNDQVIDYDKLMIATGSSAFVPPFAGLDTVEKKFTFMTLNDARALDKVLGSDQNVLIVGAGLIGLKCAEGICERVESIAVVDMAPRILSSILDDKGAQMIQKHLESKGMHFYLDNGVQSFAGSCATLSDGSTLDFDILVLAVGVRANTALVKDIADVERGIVINEKAETTAKDIYAGGDCTQSIDVSDGKEKVMALLPNAYMQGHCAGINMAGGEEIFDTAMPMNAIGFYGMHVLTAGNYVGQVYEHSDDQHYKKLFYSDNHLNGFIMIGDVEKAGIYTAMIREHTPLDTLDFNLICRAPGLMAFERDKRETKLGGVV